jgi:hypothetical protein
MATAVVKSMRRRLACEINDSYFSPQLLECAGLFAPLGCFDVVVFGIAIALCMPDKCAARL